MKKLFKLSVHPLITITVIVLTVLVIFAQVVDAQMPILYEYDHFLPFVMK